MTEKVGGFASMGHRSSCQTEAASSSMIDQRRLSEAEVQGVLSRAVELDAAEEPRDWDAATVEEIALEAGISSSAVRRAIAEIEDYRRSPDTIPENHLVRHRETAVTAGALSGDDAAFFLRLLSRLGHVDAKIDYLGSQVSWTTPEGLRVRLVLGTAETHVSTEGDIGGEVGWGGALFIGGGIAWAVALAPMLTGDLSPDLLIPVLSGAATGAVGWAVYWRHRLASLRAGVADLSRGIADTLGLLRGRRASGTDDPS